MWTRLLYLTVPQALKPQLVNGKWHNAILSGRYRALLRKTFKQHGLPFIYQTKKDTINPRHKMPKGHSHIHERPLRLAKIKKALEQNAELEMKMRQEKMNARKLTGIDKLVKQAFPSFMNTKREVSADTGDNEADLVSSLGLSRKGPKYAERKKEGEKAKSL